MGRRAFVVLFHPSKNVERKKRWLFPIKPLPSSHQPTWKGSHLWEAFLIQTSPQPGERPKEADIKTAGLSFHKKGTVDAAASGNPKNRKVPTFLLSSKIKPKPVILQRGRTLPWIPAWLPGRAQGPPVVFPGPLSSSENLLLLPTAPSSHTGTHPACHRLPQEPGWPTSAHTPQASPPTSAPQRGCPHPKSLHNTCCPARPALRHLN